MKESFQRSLAVTLKEEGGWSDDPRDPGGATMKGITFSTFKSVYGTGATKADLRNISDALVEHIYLTRYWNVCRCDELPAGLDLCVFDFAVNSGPGNAAVALQNLSGAKIDGAIGPKTLAAVTAWVKRDGIKSCIRAYQDARLKHLEDQPTFKIYGRGLTNRVVRVEGIAENMAALS